MIDQNYCNNISDNNLASKFGSSGQSLGEMQYATENTWKLYKCRIVPGRMDCATLSLASNCVQDRVWDEKENLQPPFPSSVQLP
jgi:hypothetical protein